MTTTMKDTPEEVRLGNIKATVWRNETEFGSRFNVTFERLYKDKEGRWTTSASFGPDDLLLLAKVADHAHTYIHTTKVLDRLGLR